MPYKKSKKHIKKSFGKKDKADKQFGAVDSYKIKPEPFPRVMYTRARFSQNDKFTTGGVADISVGNTFRINSIFDTDFSGVGKTIVGHSVLAQIYGRYIVTNAKVRVSFSDPLSDGLRVGCRIRLQQAGTAISKTVQNLTEQPLTYINALNDSGSQKRNYTFNLKPWSLIGISKLEYYANTSKYSNPISSDTSDPAYFDIFAVHPLLTGQTVNWIVEVVFDVKFYERKVLSSS